MNDDMRTTLLRHAEQLIRTRGYTGFSYADLAERTSIRKASVHHYFPTKADLGFTVVNEYLDRFRAELDRIEDTHSGAKDRLNAYAAIFAGSLEGGMLPLCGALSAESSVLPEEMGSLVSGFFDLHLIWLRKVISSGVAAGEFRADRGVDRSALLLLSALEGGSLIGWALEDNAVQLVGFQEALRGLLT